MDKHATNAKRFTMIVAVHLLLVKGTEVLLARRYNTGYEDGNYSVPAGHVEENESCIDAMIREAKEEVGIFLQPEDISLVHVMHRKTDRESIDFFFACSTWTGMPTINEPDKCDELRWSDIDDLPRNTIGYIRQAIDAYTRKEIYSQLGI